MPASHGRGYRRPRDDAGRIRRSPRAARLHPLRDRAARRLRLGRGLPGRRAHRLRVPAARLRRLAPFVDAHLSTIATPSGRTIAGLSAGGFGAFDIGLRASGLFGAIASWSGYFRPLHDGPFKHATKAVLRANDPTLLAAADRGTLEREHVRFFLSTGPYHSHWFRPAETTSFARELQRLGLPVRTFVYTQAKGEWQAQVDAGLNWAFGL